MSEKPTYEELSRRVLELERMVAERHQEDALFRLSEKRYQWIVENISDVVWSMDMHFQNTYVSPSVIRQRGYTPEEVKDQPLADRMSAEALEHVLSLYSRRLQQIETGDPEGWTPVSFEMEQPCKDGTWIWTANTVRLLPGPDGRPESILGVTRDITRRKRMEAALEKRIVALTRPLDAQEEISFEELFDLDDIQRIQDQFAEATGVASIITRTDGTPITRPSNFCRLCKDIIRKTEKGLANCYRSDAVLGRWNPDGPTIQTCLSGGLWDAGAGISVGGRHIANWLIGQVRDATQTDGKIRAYARQIGADEDAAIDALQEVTAMSREQFAVVAKTLFTIADQLSSIAYQNVQQARFISEKRQAARALKESAQRYRRLYENAQVGLGRLRIGDGQVLACNNRMAEIFGYADKTEFISDYVISENYVDRAQRARFLSEASKTGGLKNQEAALYRKDGSIVWVRFDTRFYPDHGYMEDVITDITDQKTAEKDRARLQEQLQQAQKMEAIGNLAGGIAHDFNNILFPIVGISEMLMDDLPAGSPERANVQEILKAGRRGSDLVKQILAFSHQSKHQKMPIRIQMVLKEVLKLVRATIPADIDIIQEIQSDCGMANADPTQIHQVAMNLITNAYHAMDHEGGSIIVRLAEADITDEAAADGHLSPGRYAVMSVSDTGSGIAPQLLDKIFEPYFTTKQQGKGTGLGLAVVYGIVREHNGDIRVDSAVGNGTTVTVHFPIVSSDVADDDVEEVSRHPTGNEHILLVDDEEAIARLGKQMLERLGYRVTSYVSSIDAV